MFWFIIFILLVVGGLLAIALGIFVSKPDTSRQTIFIGVAVLVLAFLLFVITGIKSVPTKSIAVVTSFGKVVGQPLGPGWHETWAPWERAYVIDETIQTTTFEVRQKTGQGGLDVRIGGQQTARLDITIQWRVLHSAADGLFTNYANQGPLMGVIQNAVVIRELKQVANTVMGDYNPIQDVALNSTAGNSQFTTFGPKILAAMRADIGNRVQVLNLLLPLAHYDPSTQARLNTIQHQYAATAIARQQIQTNKEQARANGQIAKSVSHDPAVLVHECLNIVANAANTGYQLPVGFTCIPGNTSLALTGK